MEDFPEEEKPGIPAWVVTFADLMSLLMCFFVLLLSFSEIDAQKFKQIAGELSAAFGVQRDVPAVEMPMGTSIIFDNFSSAPAEPTVINEIKQTTTDQKPKVDTLRGAVDSAATAAEQKKIQEQLEQLRKVLKPALSDGRINVTQEQHRIVIRVEEKGSFPSGSAKLTWEFESLLLEMAEVLASIPGELTIEGHTDDVPIRTDRFYSNWDLSAARAASVANALLASGAVAPSRLAVKGLADTAARVENDSPENRAKNRRVEIIIDLSDPLEEQEIQLRDIIDGQLPGQDAVIDMQSGPVPVESITW
ncbi:flagellar motor protein MotB [Marinobacter sp. M3C]|jgi:chemotaxis protein MotB|uniref:flagellar motor protein MotB n=1 Tax=unclassified Marinobacter TaxID=83889 RepID=UPI00200DF81E|nr:MULTISPECIES: flagellar motor protein MotB [unclassified Marinobacter]MCL1477266.1 flagellar motor protein MotB [Marinobacter sp.]MCL1480742.1 flagellar motor protein MotB [Marinobacter sp.]MCL1485896.1 flagellar motor protein MotB [Marinobacter sp.]MCL1486814.1 flagellar motor protein MotB [Marinobacter sp.]UQG56401.1 flagellar motor protein MotB [Marinobacter sp. M4C]